MSRTKTGPSPPAFHPAILVGLTLALLTGAVYFTVANHDFVNYDDNLYVTENPNVQAGLTTENISWIFTSLTGGNWHPLTMLSLLADSQLSVKIVQTQLRAPMLFHVSNLLLHCTSTFVLFWALLRMTGCLWKCAWVAALFALHPLHVESVAWVSERKDVLSGLFWMLTLIAYVRYVESPSWPRYLTVGSMMALGLLAKVMLVSLPIVLLLLDYWPLGRFSASGSSSEVNTTRRSSSKIASVWPLLREKMPFAALSALFCPIAVAGQWHGQGLRTFSDVPLLTRLQVVPLAYVVYLRKMVWPSDLAVFYPFPATGLPAWQVASAACAAILLIGITVLAWRERMRRPYLLTGWLWYLVTLVPVIGLVQVGDQMYADRYTYLPLVGIFIMVAWGFPDLISRLRSTLISRVDSTHPAQPGWVAPTLLAVATLVACSAITRIQVGYWKDSFSLWEHNLAVCPENYVAHNNLGSALRWAKRLDEAASHYKAAAELNPKNELLQNNLAMTLYLEGKAAEAMQSLETSLQFNPNNAFAHRELGRMLMTGGSVGEAVSHFRQAIRLQPDDGSAYFFLGEALMAQSNLKEAAEQLAEAARLSPGLAQAHHQLALALGRLGRWQGAANSLESAINLSPKDSTFRCDLARVLFEMGETGRSAEQYKKSSELEPDWMARSNAMAGDLLRLKGVNLGQGQRVLEIASELCQATGYQRPQFLETLAAAYAATGQMSKARETSQKAVELATAAGQKALAKQIRERAKSYQ